MIKIKGLSNGNGKGLFSVHIERLGIFCGTPLSSGQYWPILSLGSVSINTIPQDSIAQYCPLSRCHAQTLKCISQYNRQCTDIFCHSFLSSIRIQYGFGIFKWKITWRVLILKKPICCKMASACTFGLGSTITLAACHCIATSTSHCHFSKKPICLFKIFQNILFEHLRIASFPWDQMYRFSPRGVCLPLSANLTLILKLFL